MKIKKVKKNCHRTQNSVNTWYIWQKQDAAMRWKLLNQWLSGLLICAPTILEKYNPKIKSTIVAEESHWTHDMLNRKKTLQWSETHLTNDYQAVRSAHALYFQQNTNMSSTTIAGKGQWTHDSLHRSHTPQCHDAYLTNDYCTCPAVH